MEGPTPAMESPRILRDIYIIDPQTVFDLMVSVLVLSTDIDTSSW